MTEACPGCGNDRTACDTGPGWVVWHCPLCGLSREQVIEPTSTRPNQETT